MGDEGRLLLSKIKTARPLTLPLVFKEKVKITKNKKL